MENQDSLIEATLLAMKRTSPLMLEAKVRPPLDQIKTYGEFFKYGYPKSKDLKDWFKLNPPEKGVTKNADGTFSHPEIAGTAPTLLKAVKYVKHVRAGVLEK